ncbi:MAG: glycosyltransferase family 9 protein [Verrucomicrobiota bacterium]
MTCFDAMQQAQKILLLDLGFLGDTVHVLPAAEQIRAAFPEAQLDVMVAEHITSLLQLTPWVDHALGYPRFPKGPKWYQDLGRIRSLRRSRYDAVINLNGSDRSSLLTGLSGAAVRLGREREDKPPAFWGRCFTHTAYAAYGKQPLYRQRCEVLQASGFPVREPRFDITIPQAVHEKVFGELAGLDSFIHLSPFATLDYKELPLAQLVTLISQLQHLLPVVLSCAPNEREQGKLEELLKALPQPPAKVFPGHFNLIEFAALIQASRLHLGADSGAVHVALMTGCPTVSWFREYDGAVEWAPEGQEHFVAYGQASDEGLKDVSVDELVSATERLLQTTDG